MADAQCQQHTHLFLQDVRAGYKTGHSHSSCQMALLVQLSHAEHEKGDSSACS